MDYQKIYNCLVEKRRQDPPKNEYVEHHHILPKCLGGNDEISNLVILTAREHYIAHLLLAKIYRIRQLYAAAVCMRAGREQFNFNSRLYQIMREKYGKTMIGNKRRLGKKCTTEAKQRISLSLLGRKRKPFSDEWRANMRKSKLGKHVFNNGIRNIWAKECPEGFVRGRLRKKV